MSTRTRPHMVRGFGGAFGLAALGGLLCACPGLEKIDDDAENAIPEVVQQALDESCATAGCHAADGPAAGLVLSAPESAAILESTAEGYPMVEIGNIEGSYMAIKMLELEGMSGSVMPSRGAIPADQTNLPIIIGWIAGLDVGGEGGGETVPCIVPEEEPVDIDYTEHIWPIFEEKCSGGGMGCHVDGDAAELELVADDFEGTLVDVESVDGAPLPLVAKGDPDGSYLWWRLFGVDEGEPMMPIGGEMCTEELSLIYRWILELE